MLPSTHPMNSQTSIPHSLPAPTSWQVAFARMEAYGRKSLLVAKRNHPPPQGCISMTD